MQERQNDVLNLQKQLEELVAENDDLKKLSAAKIADDDKYNLPRESGRLTKLTGNDASELQRRDAEVADLKR